MNKKIALVSAFPPATGSLNEYGLHLAREFAKREDVAEVAVIADRLPEGVAEPDHGPRIRVVRCWRFNALATPFAILRSLSREKPDGVLFNVQTASFGDREAPAGLGLMTPMLARMMGHSSGVLAHNIIEGIDLENTILKGSRLRQQIVRLGGWAVSFAMSHASYLTTTLDTYADILRKRFSRANIAMVPHGTFDRPALELTDFDKRAMRVATMGKFGTYKRLETLVAAFRSLLPEYPDLELVIGGADHPNAAGYMQRIEAECGDCPGIRFAGYVAEEDVPAFFAEARLAVFDYSATTGSSGVLHQCASYGAVPVFPKIGDFVELCEREGLAGFNYEPDNAASMAQKMREALQQVERSKAMAQQNLDAVNEFPMSRVVQYHMDMLVGPAGRTAGLDAMKPGGAARVGAAL